MIEFPCPHCGINISAELSHAGASAQCPSCNQDLVVPTGPSELVRDEVQLSIVDAERALDERYKDLDSQSGAIPEDAATNHSLGDRLKTGAMSGWASVSNSIKNQSKLASMRAQIEKLKSEDLRAAHHSLGEKCFNSELFSDQLREQYQVVRELDAMIAEKRTPEDFEIGETKMATLKRLGKNVVHSSQAQAMLLKRQGLLTELGKAANLLQESEGLPGIATEKDILKGVEAQIRMIEERIAEQAEMEPQTGSTAHHDSPSKSDSSNRGSSSTVANSGGISAILWKLRNLVTKKIAIASCIILGVVMIIPFCGKSEPEKYDVGEAMLEDARALARSLEGRPCTACNGSGRKRDGCPDCQDPMSNLRGYSGAQGRGTRTTPSGHTIACSTCQGSGWASQACRNCGGSGVK